MKHTEAIELLKQEQEQEQEQEEQEKKKRIKVNIFNKVLYSDIVKPISTLIVNDIKEHIKELELNGINYTHQALCKMFNINNKTLNKILSNSISKISIQ